MNKNVSIGLMATLLSINFCATAQDSTQISPIYGTPDKFQRYFVFDNISYPEVTEWQVRISHDEFNPTDSSILRRLSETIKLEEKNFYKLEDFHYSDDFGLYVQVLGLDENENIITEDDWINDWINPADQFGWREYCKGICNASTYAYSVKINERFDYWTGNTVAGGHQVEFTDPQYLYEPNLGVYIPLFRYMTPTEWQNLTDNSQIYQNDWSLWNTLAHYGLPHTHTHVDPDGIKVVYHPNAATGQFRNMQNIKINDGPVWGVQKKFGVYENDKYQASIALPDDPGTACNLLSGSGSSHSNQINEAISFTNYANSNLIFTNSTQQLVCSNPWSVPGTTVSGGNSTGFNVDGYVFVHDAWIDWINDHPNPGTGGGLFELMEAAFQGVRSEENYTNTTGVPWWPGDDFDYIQLYRVDKTNSPMFEIPYTIYRDSLFNINGSLKSFEINTPAGLYNLSLTISEATVNLPLLVEFPTNVVHQSSDTKCDRMDITIYPVPIQGNEFTTSVTLDENASFRYQVLDDMGIEHFGRIISISPDRTHDIHVSTSNLPNGLIFHTFEVVGECIRTITTIKNE